MSAQNYDPAVRPATQMRRNRQHQAQEDAWIKDYLKTARTCTISTSWDDLPFNNITLFWYDEANHRIIAHANVTGRFRANLDQNPKICLSCYEMGKLLPSNAALEFSVQYRAVVVFGEARIIEDPEAQRQALYGLIDKYFPRMKPGAEFRPITDEELRRTSTVEIAITEWSGKVNWKDKTGQIDTWPDLSDEILAGGFA